MVIILNYKYGIWPAKKDIDVLLKEYEKNPQNLRTLFYLGQTYECLGDIKNAIENMDSQTDEEFKGVEAARATLSRMFSNPQV